MRVVETAKTKTGKRVESGQKIWTFKERAKCGCGKELQFILAEIKEMLKKSNQETPCLLKVDCPKCGKEDMFPIYAGDIPSVSAPQLHGKTLEFWIPGISLPERKRMV